MSQNCAERWPDMIFRDCCRCRVLPKQYQKRYEYKREDRQVGRDVWSGGRQDVISHRSDCGSIECGLLCIVVWTDAASFLHHSERSPVDSFFWSGQDIPVYRAFDSWQSRSGSSESAVAIPSVQSALRRMTACPGSMKSSEKKQDKY